MFILVMYLQGAEIFYLAGQFWAGHTVIITAPNLLCAPALVTPELGCSSIPPFSPRTLFRKELPADIAFQHLQLCC